VYNILSLNYANIVTLETWLKTQKPEKGIPWRRFLLEILMITHIPKKFPSSGPYPEPK
jgi:hypothetical protein